MNLNPLWTDITFFLNTKDSKEPSLVFTALDLNDCWFDSITFKERAKVGSFLNISGSMRCHPAFSRAKEPWRCHFNGDFFSFCS